MKKIILSAMMAFAFLASTSAMAQETKKETSKAKTEVKSCCKKDAKGECAKKGKKKCTKKESAKNKSCCKKDAKDAEKKS
ncbi:MAG: hypothetical protein H6Q14_701 [Bacteroidetes bacterium]|nr:hypothetical protein [Bacteroidota bacterium]